MVRVCVVGSLNMDLVAKAPWLPDVGETVTGAVFSTFPGGKGANQAVAAARLGALVTMVGCVGADAFGRDLLDVLARDGIDTSHVRIDAHAATGVAVIGVDGAGRNIIMVAPGANHRVTADDVDGARGALAAAAAVLLQLEIPMHATLRAAQLAKDAGALVCLDPAPAVPLPEALYASIDLIQPNELEARALTGITVDSVDDAARAAAVLRARGPRVAIVKMGERGAYFAAPEGGGHVPAAPAEAVDTTAAGDAFAGAVAVALAEGQPLADAVAFATRAAAVKVGRMGAQVAMPRRGEMHGAAPP